MRYSCGIDIGASATKLVILDEERRAVARSMRPSGVDYAETAEACLAEALSSGGLAREDIRSSLATGYG
ncbi:MAG: acyl-CoA dehydratase activase, partial [Planctomycetota bacterium]